MKYLKFNLLAILTSLNLGLFFPSSPVLAQRVEVSLNDGWFFSTDTGASLFENINNDQAWRPVSIPHTWNTHDVLADGVRGYYRGIGKYRKILNIPDDGRRRYLHFEGVNQVAQLYINGQLVGTHIGGYTAFTFDITDFLRPGENELAVIVDNSHNDSIPPLSADFTFFGGIYRNVKLIATGNTHFDLSNHGSMGIFIDCPEISSQKATLRVRGSIETHNKEKKLRVVASLLDSAYNRITSVSIPIKNHDLKKIDFELIHENLENLVLWNPERPYLYTVHTALFADKTILDEIYTHFGFRWFAFEPEKGFFLNGNPLKLMGANRHQDIWGLGNALTDDMHRRDIALTKNLGANFLRTAHYPQTHSVLDEADRLGLLVWEEIPIVNEIGLNAAFNENSKNMIREMIRQHYNHPSVIIWAYMNEIYWMHRFLPKEELPLRNDRTLALAKELEKIAREEDPNRYTAMAVHNFQLYEESGILEVPMIIGWNLYHGWYYDTYEDFGRFMDAQHEAHPDRILMVSEFGAGADVRLHSQNPERFDFSNEGQLNFMASFLDQILSRNYIAGASVWNLVDFNSERRGDAISHLNSKGLLTAQREPKDAYYLTKCFLSKEDELYLAHNWQNRLYSTHSDAFTDNWKGKITAFSNMEVCSLYVNGIFYSSATPSKCMVQWDVSLKQGINTICIKANGLSKCAEKEFISIPQKLKHPVDLALNMGTSQSFYDVHTDITWVPSPKYSPGGYGYIGSTNLFINGKLGTKEDILTTEYLDPLFQTMIEGVQAVKFDVPNGKYEIELYMVDYVPFSRRFIDVDEHIRKVPGQRVFDVFANNKALYNNLDLGGEYGLNIPVRLRFDVIALNNEGIKLEFVPKTGDSILSAIRVRSK